MLSKSIIRDWIQNITLWQFKNKGEYHFSLRPYKYNFYRILQKCLELCEPYNSVLDCASASGKHRHLFIDKTYYGVDLDLELIESAKSKYGNENTFFFCDNILQMKSDISIRKYDLVVSTHTLAHIDELKLDIAINNLLNLAEQRQGKLILHFTGKQKDTIIDLLNKEDCKKTSIIKRYEYGGRISLFYENLLCKVFGVNDVYLIPPSGNSIARKLLMFLLLNVSLLLSYLDRFTPPFSQYICIIFLNNRNISPTTLVHKATSEEK